MKDWVGVCDPLPKPLTLWWPKSAIFPSLVLTWPEIRDPIYDVTLKSILCYRPALQSMTKLRTMLNCRKHNLWRAFVDGLIDNDDNVTNAHPTEGYGAKTLPQLWSKWPKSTPYLWPKCPKSIPYLWPKRLKNHLLLGRTCLYSPYKGVTSGSFSLFSLHFFVWRHGNIVTRYFCEKFMA